MGPCLEDLSKNRSQAGLVFARQSYIATNSTIQEHKIGESLLGMLIHRIQAQGWSMGEVESNYTDKHTVRFATFFYRNPFLYSSRFDGFLLVLH